MWTAILLIIEKTLELVLYLVKRSEDPKRKKEKRVEELSEALSEGDTASVDARLTRALSNVRRKRKRLPAMPSGKAGGGVSAAGDSDGGHGQDPV